MTFPLNGGRPQARASLTGVRELSPRACCLPPDEEQVNYARFI